MLIRMLLSGDSFLDILTTFLFAAAAMLIVIPVHELAHSFTAYKLGDDSQKLRGRLTLNPFKHLDPLGAVCLLLTGFGWAKPVMVDSSRLRKGGKFSMAIVSLAGPAANILTGTLFAVLYKAVQNKALDLISSPAATSASMTALSVLLNGFFVLFQISVNLAVFNLIPLPPLDGFGVISPLLPPRATAFMYKYRHVISIAFVVLLVTGALSVPISAASGFICKLIMKGVDLIL